jgi:hypothetical protein
MDWQSPDDSKPCKLRLDAYLTLHYLVLSPVSHVRRID